MLKQFKIQVNKKYYNIIKNFIINKTKYHQFHLIFKISSNPLFILMLVLSDRIGKLNRESLQA